MRPLIAAIQRQENSLTMTVGLIAVEAVAVVGFAACSMGFDDPSMSLHLAQWPRASAFMAGVELMALLNEVSVLLRLLKRRADEAANARSLEW